MPRGQKRGLKVLVIHGPNLNLLGIREKEIYGSLTLDNINKEIIQRAKKLALLVNILQSNSEGEIVTQIQEASGRYDCLIINPAAYTHTSVAIRDAIIAIGIPTIEVHISNIFKREEFRRKSFISDIAVGHISGLGKESYLLALEAAAKLFRSES